MGTRNKRNNAKVAIFEDELYPLYNLDGEPDQHLADRGFCSIVVMSEKKRDWVNRTMLEFRKVQNYLRKRRDNRSASLNRKFSLGKGKGKPLKVKELETLDEYMNQMPWVDEDSPYKLGHNGQIEEVGRGD